jgi:hypothetical protein
MLKINTFLQFLFGLGIFSLGFVLLVMLIIVQFPFDKEWSVVPLFPIVAITLMMIGGTTAAGRGPLKWNEKPGVRSK